MKTSYGPSPILTNEEEIHIEHWIIECAKKSISQEKRRHYFTCTGVLKQK